MLDSVFRSKSCSSDNEILHNRHVIFTHKGRSGLGLLCHHWNLKVGYEVLMPAYNCGTEIDPFIYHGLRIIFYRVNNEAQIDLNDLQRRVTTKTKVIYVTHYFGWSQNLDFLSTYCRENDIHLIEDCALSLFSNPVDHPIGVLGNAAIYSLPKTLPVPDGGMLTIPATQSFPEEPIEPPPLQVILIEMLSLLKRATLRLTDRLRIYRYLPKRLIQSRKRKGDEATTPAGFPEIPRSYYFNQSVQKMTASGISRYILDHSCSASIVNQRRENYFQLSKSAKETRLFQLLFDQLPEGVCPLYFPVIVEDRKKVCNRLNEMGIAAMQWWSGYHRAFDWKEFPEARYLKDHVLTIPIHQQLSSKNMDYISSSMALIGN
jgi:dTDP-4-amino-4,6-dideoxygalactose transaminase